MTKRIDWMTTVYKDSKTTIKSEHGYLQLYRKDGTKVPCSPALAKLPDPVTVPQLQADLLRKRGDDPADYDAYQMPGKDMYLVLPKAAAAPLLAARDDYRARLDAKRNDPATVERNRIHRLFSEAEELRDYPGEYYPALSRANAALNAWQEKYPAKAAKEKANALLAKAAKEDELATGAYCYDADGWLSREDQEQGAAEHRAKADEYRKQAAEILRNI